MMINARTVIRVAVISLVVMVGHSWLRGAAAQQSSNVAPYIIVASNSLIRRINLNERNEISGEPITLVNEPLGPIVGIDYHYRLGYVFWTSDFGRSVKQASLEDGSNITTLVQGLASPGDLAVDWINDKLYWTDRRTDVIEEYDLITGIRKEIISTRTQPDRDSAANGLAIYPYPNYGWLYWTDTATKTIERAAITGDGREVIRQEPQDSCVYPLLLEYVTHTIYWIDTCAFFLKSVRMDGSLSSNEVNIARNIQRSTGMTLLHDSLYWTEPFDIYTTNITTGTPVHHLFQSTQFQSLGGIEVVHPDKQPNAEEFIEKILSGVTPEELNDTCPVCDYGQCIPPGLCACDSGWTQLDCSEDINECATANGRCDHNCTNTKGSYFCTCNEGFSLHSNGRSCIENVTPTMQFPIGSTSTPLPLQPSTSITTSPVVPTSAHVTSSYISSSVQPTSTFAHITSSTTQHVIISTPQPEITTAERTTTASPKPEASGVPIAYVVGSAAAAVIIILLVVNIVVVVLCCWKRHKTGSYKVDHEKRPPMITVVYHRPNSSSSTESKSTTSTANSSSSY